MSKDAVIGRRRATFRAVASAVVPDLAVADEDVWRDVETTVERALELRPPRMRAQLRLLLTVLEMLARVRFARPLHAVPAPQRERFLQALQHSPILLVRRGLWGLRTLVFMGHYTRQATLAAVGYRADPRGWSARAVRTAE